jgi:5-formyltetrahydrofolate cyclo-ligase
VAAGQDPAACGTALGDHLLRALPPPAGAVVSGFWPLREEIDIRPLLLRLHAQGHDVALPVTPGRGAALTFRLWRPGDVLQRERFGTMRPTGPAVVPDYLLVPLLAFDRACHRLGYGGGYYDRTLAAAGGRIAVGCAYAVQQVDAVPVGPYDVPLHAVATERGVIFREAG